MPLGGCSPDPCTPPANERERKEENVIPTYDSGQPNAVTMTDDATLAAARRRKRTITGITALTIAIICLFLASILPSGFVIRQPGPVVNTLGEVQDTDGNEIPLIEMPADVETFETSGALSLTTVQIVGNRESTPNWFQLAQAWFDPSKAVMNIDQVFPKEQTSEERQEQDALMMANSQHDATAAALIELGYDVPIELQIAQVLDDGASVGKLEVGDVVNSINGTPVADVLDMRDAIAAGNGADVTVNVVRDGEAQDVVITPVKGDADGETIWMIGVSAGPAYDFPFDVSIMLENIGGPSAGMIFALGIIDSLTPGEMTGGKSIAGTGTINYVGEVGPIGGIQQKMQGAVRAGSEYFLAPAANCNEVVGHVPDGLTVVKVAKLSEARDAVETIGEGDTDAIAKLLSCSSK